MGLTTMASVPAGLISAGGAFSATWGLQPASAVWEGATAEQMALVASAGDAFIAAANNNEHAYVVSADGGTAGPVQRRNAISSGYSLAGGGVESKESIFINGMPGLGDPFIEIGRRAKIAYVQKRAPHDIGLTIGIGAAILAWTDVTFLSTDIMNGLFNIIGYERLLEQGWLGDTITMFLGVYFAREIMHRTNKPQPYSIFLKEFTNRFRQENELYIAAADKKYRPDYEPADLLPAVERVMGNRRLSVDDDANAHMVAWYHIVEEAADAISFGKLDIASFEKMLAMGYVYVGEDFKNCAGSMPMRTFLEIASLRPRGVLALMSIFKERHDMEALKSEIERLPIKWLPEDPNSSPEELAIAKAWLKEHGNTQVG